MSDKRKYWPPAPSTLREKRIQRLVRDIVLVKRSKAVKCKPRLDLETGVKGLWPKGCSVVRAASGNSDKNPMNPEEKALFVAWKKKSIRRAKKAITKKIETGMKSASRKRIFSKDNIIRALAASGTRLESQVAAPMVDNVVENVAAEVPLSRTQKANLRKKARKQAVQAIRRSARLNA